MQTIDTAGPVTEQGISNGHRYEVRDGGTVRLGPAEYTVTIHTTIGVTDDDPTVNLTGRRGGVYFLRGYLGEDTGRRQVISWKSGQPLRVKGNEVRVTLLGNTLETEYLR